MMIKHILFILAFSITASAQVVLTDWNTNETATTGKTVDGTFTKPKSIAIPSWPTDPSAVPEVTLADDPVIKNNKVVKFVRTTGTSQGNSLSIRWGSSHDTDGDGANGPGTAPTGISLGGGTPRPYVKFSVYSVDKTDFKLKLKFAQGSAPEWSKNVSVTLNTWTDFEVYFDYSNTDVVTGSLDNLVWNTVMDIGFNIDEAASGETFYVKDVSAHTEAHPKKITVSVDPSEYNTANSTTVGMNIVTNASGNWGEAPATERVDGTFSYDFSGVADGTTIEYVWKAYPDDNGVQENLVPAIGGGGLDNALVSKLPTNEALNTDYSNYANRTVVSNGDNYVAQTYIFNSVRVSGQTYTQLTVDTGTAGQNIVMDYSLNDFNQYHGPGTTDNGDGTYTAYVHPDQAFEYKWNNLTLSTAEDLTSCSASGAAINTDNSTYANRVHVAGENKSDTFNACPADPAIALSFDFEEASQADSWSAVADTAGATGTKEHVATGGNPDGALNFGGINDVDGAGKSYQLQYSNGAFDYGDNGKATLTFDLKANGAALNGAALHLQFETPSGLVQDMDIQNDGLNADTWTTYTLSSNGFASGTTGILRINLNMAAGAFTGAGGALLIDNVKVTLSEDDSQPEAEPTDAPTTPPTKDAADVISIYGEAYGTHVGLNNVGWDQGEATEVSFAGNNVLKATFTGAFIGFDLGAESDATEMTHFHMDVWFPADFQAGQTIIPKFSNHNGGGETDAFNYTYAVSDGESGSWVSIDVPLTDFTNARGDGQGVDGRANLKQLLFNASSLPTVYFDNIYLYKDTTASVDDVNSNFNVYPNPIQNTLNVSAGVSVDQVSIFDLTGREVMRATPNASAFSLDVANLNKGLYLVSLKAGDQEMTTKLVK